VKQGQVGVGALLLSLNPTLTLVENSEFGFNRDPVNECQSLLVESCTTAFLLPFRDLAKMQAGSLREPKEADLRAVLFHHNVSIWRNPQNCARRVIVPKEHSRSLRVEDRKTAEYDSIAVI